MLLLVFLLQRPNLCPYSSLDSFDLQLIQTFNQVDHLVPLDLVVDFYSIDLHAAFPVARVPQR